MFCVYFENNFLFIREHQIHGYRISMNGKSNTQVFDRKGLLFLKTQDIEDQ